MIKKKTFIHINHDTNKKQQKYVYIRQTNKKITKNMRIGYQKKL